MTSLFQFNAEDAKAVKSTEEKWIKLRKKTLLDIKFTTWLDLIDQCEKGFDDDVSEYTNSLASRDALQEILDVLSDSGRASFGEMVDSLDRRFKDSTVQVRHPILDYQWINPQKHFWYYRIPKRIKKEELSAFESQYGGDLKGVVETF